MKIDPNRTGFDTVGAVKTDATETTPSAPRAGQAGPTGQSDQVQLSTGAQLAGAAVKAAADAPDVRAAEVERAKALVQGGEVGTDPYRLAEALIDRAMAGD